MDKKWISLFLKYRLTLYTNGVLFKHLKKYYYFIDRVSNDSMAQNFNTRVKILDLKTVSKNLDKAFNIDGISKGKVALVYLSVYLNVLKNRLVAMGMEQDIDFHISEYGDPWKACFIWYSAKNMNDEQIFKLNSV